MEIISLVSLLIFGGGVYILSKVFRNFQPGSKKIQADLKKMKEEIDALSAELVPLDTEELEAVSYSQTDQALKKRFTTTARGIFTTIYHEPVIAYNYKRYSGTNIQALIFAETKDHQYAFLVRKKGVQVVIDKNLVGTFKDNTLYGTRRNQVLARLQKGPEDLISVMIGKREVASMMPKTENQPAALGQRAFSFVKPDIQAEEIRLFLAVAILYMVEKVVPSKKKKVS